MQEPQHVIPDAELLDPRGKVAAITQLFINALKELGIPAAVMVAFGESTEQIGVLTKRTDGRDVFSDPTPDYDEFELGIYLGACRMCMIEPTMLEGERKPGLGN